MQKSPNRANRHPWHGYYCMCCSGWSCLSRAQLKKEAERDIELGLEELESMDDDYDEDPQIRFPY